MPRTTIAHAQFVHTRLPFRTCRGVEVGVAFSKKLLFAYCASSKCRNDKGSVVHYSHRDDLVIGLLH